MDRCFYKTPQVAFTFLLLVAICPPVVGQFLEITGRTAPGDFSPVVFAHTAKLLCDAAMPEPTALRGPNH